MTPTEIKQIAVKEYDFARGLLEEKAGFDFVRVYYDELAKLVLADKAKREEK